MPGNTKKLAKELLLLRHAKSDWNGHTSDFNRPLKKRGKSNAKQMGLWLAEQNLIPDLIITSPAIRALHTAQIICKFMQISESTIEQEKLLYLADESDWLTVLSTIPLSINRLMLVGHNPGMENLLSYFVPNIKIPEDGKLLPTATLAYLVVNQQWKSLQSEYYIQRPKNLPAAFLE
ncbi:MAG: histidine phosphatase family protein [Pseudomonadota bacterium]